MVSGDSLFVQIIRSTWDDETPIPKFLLDFDLWLHRGVHFVHF